MHTFPFLKGCDQSGYKRRVNYWQCVYQVSWSQKLFIFFYISNNLQKVVAPRLFYLDILTAKYVGYIFPWVNCSLMIKVIILSRLISELNVTLNFPTGLKDRIYEIKYMAKKNFYLFFITNCNVDHVLHNINTNWYSLKIKCEKSYSSIHLIMTTTYVWKCTRFIRLRDSQNTLNYFETSEKR